MAQSYDAIGRTYTSKPHPDPRIAAPIERALYGRGAAPPFRPYMAALRMEELQAAGDASINLQRSSRCRCLG
jgi:hypothetical protein